MLNVYVCVGNHGHIICVNALLCSFFVPQDIKQNVAEYDGLCTIPIPYTFTRIHRHSVCVRFISGVIDWRKVLVVRFHCSLSFVRSISFLAVVVVWFDLNSDSESNIKIIYTFFGSVRTSEHIASYYEVHTAPMLVTVTWVQYFICCFFVCCCCCCRYCCFFRVFRFVHQQHWIHWFSLCLALVALLHFQCYAVHWECRVHPVQLVLVCYDTTTGYGRLEQHSLLWKWRNFHIL